MKEAQLLELLQNKETRERGFTELVNQYSQKLYWTIRHIVGNHEEADDVLQDTFIKIWNKLDDFRGEAKISTWIHRIAVNETLDHIRRENKHKGGDYDVNSVRNVFADEYFDGDETERMLREAMETLPEAQRAVFSLKYFENKQYKEISEILGTSEGGLKANYHYAVEKIKNYFSRKSLNL